MLRALIALPSFAAAMLAALLPYRYWHRLPAAIRVGPWAFLSGIITLLAGAAIGIPGFIDHAHGNASVGLDAAVADMYKTEVYRGDLVMGYSGLSIFTFFLLTPQGWLTLYLLGSGGIRAGAAWFDDPVGDPVLTALDHWFIARRTELRARGARTSRSALEGPEVPDRVVTGAFADMPACDIVVVASRRKAGWDRGTVVFTPDAVYRLGEPVERTIAGRLRTLYPLTEHTDLEVVRRSVQYDLPGRDGKPG